MRDLLALLGLLVLLLLVLGNYGQGPVTRDGSRGSSVRDDVVDLGIAKYPQRAEALLPAEHSWSLAFMPLPYRVSYLYGEQAFSDAKYDHRRMAREWRYRPLKEGRFVWRRPASCAAEPWDCVYRQMFERSAPDVAPLLRLFRDHAIRQRWHQADIARWLLAFVQEIEYRIPEQYAFGILPPPLVLSLSYGDCDSKSLLLLHLLAEFDIEARMIRSDAHQHALVGINVPGTGAGIKHRGRKYLWAETTAERAPLGWIHPSLKSPDDWEIMAAL